MQLPKVALTFLALACVTGAIAIPPSIGTLKETDDTEMSFFEISTNMYV